MTKKNKIALIDGYGFVFRAFHSLPPLTRADGTPVGAVYGFTNMLIRLIAGLDVTHIAVVFDSGGKTFRNEIYTKYKANRPPCPEELIPQFPLIREAAQSLNIHILEKAGFEADDIIATIAKGVDKEKFEVVIVSSDKDLMQLVENHVIMYDAMKNKIIAHDEVKEKFAVTPNQVLDVLSLIGDASDNVPGVKGIGPKTAAELINQYQNLENLFNHLDEIKQEKRRELLKNGVANAQLSKTLIALRYDVPIDLDMKNYEIRSVDPHRLIEFLDKQGFKSLISRIKREFQISEEQSYDKKEIIESAKISNTNQNQPSRKIISFEEINKIKIKDLAELKILKKQAEENGNLVIDLAYSSQNKSPKILTLSSFKNGFVQKEIFYLEIKDPINSSFLPITDLFEEPSSNQQSTKSELEFSSVIAELKTILDDNSIIKIGYRVKELLKSFDLKISTINDIEIMSYVINSEPKQSNLHNLIATNLIDDIENNGFGSAFEEIEKNKIPEIFSDPKKKFHFYNFKNYAIGQLHNILKNKIFKDKLSLVYFGFERPLLKILAEMEIEGIMVDKIKLKKLSEEFDLRIKQLTNEIHHLAQEDFNIGSPKQLATILFEKLNLQSKKKSAKTGNLSTNSEILEELDLEGHIIAGKILEWRHVSKLKSTYSDALQKQINPTTKRIHTTFSNTGTITGRLSSNNPNLQNIPIRSKEGVKIRQAFIAKKGYKLLSADYSQIELRVLSHIASIESLKQAFVNKKDIHSITASQIFNVDESQVNPEMRRKAKAINFGIIYGISPFGLAKQLKISRQEANGYIDAYFATYPGIKNYMNQYQDIARKQGFVTTIIGRKCFTHDINHKNPVIRNLAERLSINAPIQGSAADIIKKAMIDLSLRLKEENLASRLILQIHDELILEVPETEIKQISELVRKVMENAVKLDVPITVDLETGDFLN